MTARYGEWQLLGESDDPVPGNSVEIRSEGLHYSDVARDISTQVRALRNLADGDVSKGAYLDSIRENCDDTAGDLERVHHRFETVGSQLQSWADDVETARSETWSALQLAEDADATLRANPAPDPRLPGAPPLTPDEATDINRTTSRRDAAEGQLTDAKVKFDRAMSTYNSRAEDVARAIRDASDDDMKDSTWDKIKDWVSRNADWLKLVADIIGWIVTVVAIVALFCTPVGWILLGVAAIAVVGLGIRALLAASGEGSWTDFAIDLVGVLTLGTGKVATAIAKGGRTATLAAIGRFTGAQARGSKVTSLLTKFRSAPWYRKPATWLFETNPAMRYLAGRAAYRQTYLSWVNKPLPELTPWQILRGGGDDAVAAMRREIADLSVEFPQLVTRGYDTASRIAAGAGMTGWAFDATDKLLGDSLSTWDEAFGIEELPPFLQWADGGKPGLEPYGDLKDRWSYSPGGHLN